MRRLSLWFPLNRRAVAIACVIAWVSGAVALTAGDVAAHGSSRESGKTSGPNPLAPEPTAEYAFLIGTWECETRFMKPDGSGYQEGNAVWTGEWILNGYAVQDFWVSELPDGRQFHGTNIRSFDSKRKKWDNRWLPMGLLQWKQFDSEMVGDTMVMTGGAGKDARGDFIDRNTFYDIRDDSWSWRKDRSYNRGDTWVEGIGYIEAERAE